MIPQPHEQFITYQWFQHIPARNGPFICQHVSNKTVFAVDAGGNERIFPERTWVFYEAERPKEVPCSV